MKDPKVAVITLNWNGLDDTLECLGSLGTINYPNTEVVVVDNGSAHNEAEAIKKAFPDIHLIKNAENLGYTGGCNQGMTYALKTHADYVLLLNNDTVVTKDFLRTMVQFYEATPDVGAVSPLILYADREHVWFAGGKLLWGMVRHSHKGQRRNATDIPGKPFASPFVPGTAMLISTKRLKEIGMFDDRFFAYYEDVDWCNRARLAGYQAYVLPEAVIYHKKSGSTSEGGHRRFNKIPAYYIARNAVLIASDWKPFKKFWYLVAQVCVKLPVSLVLLVDTKAWGSYVRGLTAGIAAVIRPSR